MAKQVKKATKQDRVDLIPDRPEPYWSAKVEALEREALAPPVDPFHEKVSQWLTEAHEAKIVIDSGNSISPGEVQRLMTRAIGIIETLSAK
jgi:hypothetical protein